MVEEIPNQISVTTQFQTRGNLGPDLQNFTDDCSSFLFRAKPGDSNYKMKDRHQLTPYAGESSNSSCIFNINIEERLSEAI